MWILDLLFNSREPRAFLAPKILGCFFLMLSGGGGAYFLFQALAVELGYFESGAITCGILLLLGVSLLVIGRQKKPSPQEEASKKILNAVKDLDIEKILKEMALPLSLLSLGAGFILSQIKDSKNFSRFYNIFK